MQEFDCDHGQLMDDDGNISTRDVVQFVQFDIEAKKGNLQKKLLEEIPDQFMQYMKFKMILPKADF